MSAQNRNLFQKIYDEIKWFCKKATAGSEQAKQFEDLKKLFEKVYRESEAKAAEGTRYSVSNLEAESSNKAEVALDNYTEKQYNNFGWARATGAITKNELDDLYSKLQTKGTMKAFPQSKNGEAIVEVNDNPNTTLGVNNVLAFVVGTKDNPIITRIVRFDAETDTEMEIIKEDLYEGGTFSNPYYSFLEAEGFAREYRKESAISYNEYARKVRSGSSGAESNRTDGNRGFQRNRSWSFDRTESNDIAPTNEATSSDAAFFDGKKKFSLSPEADQSHITPKTRG